MAAVFLAGGGFIGWGEHPNVFITFYYHFHWFEEIKMVIKMHVQ